MFDVLEHVEDEAKALRMVSQKLKPGGRIVLSVPAYMWLSGQQDIVNHHYRRYRLRELIWKLQAADFTIERITYFNTFLFAPIAGFRLIACYGVDHIDRRETSRTLATLQIRCCSRCFRQSALF